MIPVMSLVGFKTAEEITAYSRRFGSQMQFELSYLTPKPLLEELHPLLAGKTASVHACCPQTEFFPNLASGDSAVVSQSFADLRLTLRTALEFGADIAVLHTGYVTDRAMPRDYAARKRILDSAEFARDVADKKSAICFADYTVQPQYRNFAQRAMVNLAVAAAEFRKRGVRLAAENLNPRVGYLFQTPQEMCELAAYHSDIFLCLDVGHLYIASFVFGFDFLQGVKQILATGKVVSCHIHSNHSSRTVFEDQHLSIDKHGFAYREIIHLLRRHNTNAVLEVIEEFEHNTCLLLDLLR